MARLASATRIPVEGSVIRRDFISLALRLWEAVARNRISRVAQQKGGWAYRAPSADLGKVESKRATRVGTDGVRRHADAIHGEFHQLARWPGTALMTSLLLQCARASHCANSASL